MSIYENPPMSDKSKSVLLMLASALSFAFMGAMVKFAGDLPVFEKVLFRNLVSLIIAFVSVRKSGEMLFGKSENRKYLLARSLFGLTGVVLYFYSIDNMYLADSAMLNKLSPFFVVIFAYFFLKEKISKIQIPGIIIVFAASLLIIKPQFDLSILPALAGVGGAAVAGAAYTLVRYLGGKEKPATIVFFFSFISVIGMLPIVALDFVMPSLGEFAALIGTGIFAAIGQFGLTYAYKYALANEVSVYNYSHIIFSAGVGFLFWGEISDIYSIIGGSIVILVSVVIYLFNRNR